MTSNYRQSMACVHVKKQTKWLQNSYHAHKDKSKHTNTQSHTHTCIHTQTHTHTKQKNKHTHTQLLMDKQVRAAMRKIKVFFTCLSNKHVCVCERGGERGGERGR